MPIPGYIRDRFARPIPPDCCVAPDSLPVIANGDPGVARVATIGLNPGGPYPDPKPDTPEEAWEEQKRYFQGNVYGAYFTPLEKVLNECGASYYDGSACNLDLVCWATAPHWSGVPDAAQRELLNADHEFFTTLLAENSNIELLLGNGRTVCERMAEKFEVKQVSAPDIAPELYCGKVEGRLFIGWSTFLNNSPLNTEQRAEMARRVSEWRRSGGCP